MVLIQPYISALAVGVTYCSQKRLENRLYNITDSFIFKNRLLFSQPSVYRTGYFNKKTVNI